SAGLMGEEFYRGLERVDHASGLIHDDHASGTGHASRGQEGVEIHGDVDLIGSQDLCRGAAGGYSLELGAITNATGAFDQAPQRHTYWLLIDAGPDDVPAHTE